MVKDIVSNIRSIIVLLGSAIASNTTTTGASVDTADFGEGLAFFCNVRSFTDGVYTLSAQESDDNVNFTAVAAEKVIGSSAQSAATGSNPMGKIGVFSTKRYVRPIVVSTGVTTGATVDVVAVQAGEYLPV